MREILIFNETSSSQRTRKVFFIRMFSRVPIADLSENSPDYRKQHLHPEYMNIVLQGAHLEVPKFLPHDLLSHGTMILQCKMLTSSFAGDLGVLNCLADELCFMHADSSSGLESSRNSIK